MPLASIHRLAFGDRGVEGEVVDRCRCGAWSVSARGEAGLMMVRWVVDGGVCWGASDPRGCGSAGRAGDDLSPFAEGRISGDPDGGGFFSFGENLEEQLGAAGVEVDVAEFIEAEPVDESGEASFVVSFGEFVGELGGGDGAGARWVVQLLALVAKMSLRLWDRLLVAIGRSQSPMSVSRAVRVVGSPMSVSRAVRVVGSPMPLSTTLVLNRERKPSPATDQRCRRRDSQPVGEAGPAIADRMKQHRRGDLSTTRSCHGA